MNWIKTINDAIEYMENHLTDEITLADIAKHVNLSAFHFQRAFSLLTDMSPEEWDRVLRVNVTSLYNTCHTYVPDMVSAGGGRILNVSSVWGLCGASCEVAYSASKGAVNAFTRALARELAPSHIQVNALAPGIVNTRMNEHLSENETAEIASQIPAGYIVSPEEVAGAALRLLDMPEYFNGEVVRLDGCWT